MNFTELIGSEIMILIPRIDDQQQTVKLRGAEAWAVDRESKKSQMRYSGTWAYRPHPRRQYSLCLFTKLP